MRIKAEAKVIMANVEYILSTLDGRDPKLSDREMREFLINLYKFCVEVGNQ